MARVTEQMLYAWQDFDPPDSWPVLDIQQISRIQLAFYHGWIAAHQNWLLIRDAPKSDNAEDNNPVLVLQDGRRYIAEWDPAAGHWSGIFALDGIETEKYYMEWPGRLYGATHWTDLPIVPEELKND
jgi:hypothetical protein